MHGHPSDQAVRVYGQRAGAAGADLAGSRKTVQDPAGLKNEKGPRRAVRRRRGVDWGRIREGDPLRSVSAEAAACGARV